MLRLNQSIIVFVILCTALAIPKTPLAQQSLAAANGSVNTVSFNADVESFLEKELGTHLTAIATLQPAPDRILGVPTTGEFSWGTFMRSLAAYAETSVKENFVDEIYQSGLDKSV